MTILGGPKAAAASQQGWVSGAIAKDRRAEICRLLVVSVIYALMLIAIQRARGAPLTELIETPRIWLTFFPIVVLAGFTICVGVTCVRLWRWRHRPEAHPLPRSLSRYGPVGEVMVALDADMARGFSDHKKILISSTWVLLRVNKGWQAIRRDELMGAELEPGRCILRVRSVARPPVRVPVFARQRAAQMQTAMKTTLHQNAQAGWGPLPTVAWSASPPGGPVPWVPVFTTSARAAPNPFSVQRSASGWVPVQRGYTVPVLSPAEFKLAKRRRVVIIVAVGALVSGLAAVVGSISLRDPWPKRWDPRVAPLVSFVEKARGRPFQHPVKVTFLSNSDFDQKVIGSGRVKKGWVTLRDGAALPALVCSDSPQSSWARCNVNGRALDPDRGAAVLLGFISPGASVDVEFAELTGGDIVGVFRPRQGDILVRGQLDPTKSVTIVHELTHAWQNQQFGRVLDRAKDGDERMALRALVEGDAVRIENQYRDSLPPDQQNDIQSAEDEDFTQWTAKEDNRAAQAEVGDSSVTDDRSRSFELAAFDFPYRYGPRFVEAIAARGGENAVDSAFLSLPAGTDQILDPEIFFAQTVRPESPIISAHEGRDFVRNHLTFGAYRLQMLLAPQVGSVEARRIASNWNGDSMQVTQTGSGPELRLEIVFNYPFEPSRDTHHGRDFEQAMVKVGKALGARVETADANPATPVLRLVRTASVDTMQLPRSTVPAPPDSALLG